MNAVTVTEAKKHLEQLIHQVLADAEPMTVVTDAESASSSYPSTSSTHGMKPCTSSLTRPMQLICGNRLLSSRLVFTPSAWEDYLWFQEHDRRLLKRINVLIKDILRAPLEGSVSQSH